MKKTYKNYIAVLTVAEVVAMTVTVYLCEHGSPHWSKAGFATIWLALAGIQAQIAKNGCDR